MRYAVSQTIHCERINPRQRLPGKTGSSVQEKARRRAIRQLLRVPPERFSQVQLDYLDWEAFLLWVRAVVEAEGRLPAQISRILEERCPGFLAHEKRCRESHPKQLSPLPLLLLEWIHDRVFAQAKQDGWLDALIFFSVRKPYSERTWAYWEHCENEWKRKRPIRYPNFNEWRLQAESWKGCPPVGRKQRAAGGRT